MCQQGKNFTNKLWNALKLINGWEVDDKKSQPVENKLAINWYKNKFHNTLDLIDKNFSFKFISFDRLDKIFSLYLEILGTSPT